MHKGLKPFYLQRKKTPWSVFQDGRISIDNNIQGEKRCYNLLLPNDNYHINMTATMNNNRPQPIHRIHLCPFRTLCDHIIETTAGLTVANSDCSSQLPFSTSTYTCCFSVWSAAREHFQKYWWTQ